MHLKESGEMYLETILILNNKLPQVRAIDIVNYTGYTKPSISRAVGLLKDGGYIAIDSDGYITLTDSGNELASKIYERHTLLTTYFKFIGVSEQTAIEDACKIEHDISDETFEAIKNHANKALNNKNSI